MYQAWGKDKPSSLSYHIALNIFQLWSCLTHQLCRSINCFTVPTLLTRTHLAKQQEKECWFQSSGGWPLWFISLQITVRAGVHPRGRERQDPQVSAVPFPDPRRPTPPSVCAAGIQGVFPANQVNDHPPLQGPDSSLSQQLGSHRRHHTHPGAPPFRSIA